MGFRKFERSEARTVQRSGEGMSRGAAGLRSRGEKATT
jgi:hypothetical protein